MEQKRIDEIRAMFDQPLPIHVDRAFARRYVYELLDALEAAQAGNDRLREALRQVEPLCLDDAEVAIEDGGIRTVTRCIVCSARFPGGTHTEICPFKMLEGGDEK